MSWLTLHLASGAAFFSGAGLLTVALAVTAVTKRPSVRVLAWLLAFLGVLLVACSATPLPWWSYSAWAGLVLTAMLWATLRARGRGAVLFAVATILAGLTIVAAEGRHHTRPAVPASASRTLYIIGDSLSAGTSDRGAATWPELIRVEHGVDVVNLSRGGATVASALHDLDTQPPLGDGLVLLEIGGNDQFGRTPTPEFEANLARLLARVRGAGRQVALLELPLLPLNNGYGRVQRRLAAERGAVLIPKRYLVDVVSSAQATTNGVHLTAAGHRRMAKTVWDLIGPAFPAPAATADHAVPR